MVRVQKELRVLETQFSFSLTGKRHGVGKKPKQAAGEYHLSPGKEIQHDIIGSEDEREQVELCLEQANKGDPIAL